MTSIDASARPAARGGLLPRRLGTFSAASVVVGLIIGSGIYRVPAPVAAAAGSAGGVAALWALGGLVTLAMALSLAELAAAYPRAGGVYVFLREAYGPRVAFLFGWTFLFVNPAAWAAIAHIFAAYLATILPVGAGGERAVAVAVVVTVTAANYRSVGLGAAVENEAATAKVLALGGLALAVFLLADAATGAFGGAPAPGPASWGGFWLALVPVMFSYEGSAQLTALAGEVRDPGRSLPRALALGVAVVTLVYLAANAAYLFALPLASVAASPSVAADAARVVLGGAGAAVVAVLVMVSTFSSVNAAAMTDPRVFFAMAGDGVFFRRFAAVHPRFGTPHLAVAWTGALAVVYASFGGFAALAERFILGMWPFYALAVAAVLVLRRRAPALPRPYRTPGYPFVPLFFVAASLFLVGNAVLERPGTSALNLVLILLGLPAYEAWRRVAARGAVPAEQT